MCQKTWGGELLLQVLTLDSSYFSEAHSTQWDEIYFKGSSLVAENLALIALLWICFVWWNVIQFCFPGGILISIGFKVIMNSRKVRVHWLATLGKCNPVSLPKKPLAQLWRMKAHFGLVMHLLIRHKKNLPSCDRLTTGFHQCFLK